MLAILFLACRMRVTWLTQGRGNPPTYVQAAMYSCTYAVLAMTLIVCVIPIFTGKVIGVDVKTGDVKDDVQPIEQPIVAGCFTAFKFLIMIGLYIGSARVARRTVRDDPLLPVRHRVWGKPGMQVNRRLDDDQQ